MVTWLAAATEAAKAAESAKTEMKVPEKPVQAAPAKKMSGTDWALTIGAIAVIALLLVVRLAKKKAPAAEGAAQGQEGEEKKEA